MTHQSVGDFEMPMAFNQLPRFENLNKIQVNILRYEKKALILLWKPKRQELASILDFILLNYGQADHYVSIKDLKTLVSNSKQQVPRSSSKIYRNCVHVCFTAESYEGHIETCKQNEAATIQLQDEMKNNLQFQNYQSTSLHLALCILTLSRYSNL